MRGRESQYSCCFKIESCNRRLNYSFEILDSCMFFWKLRPVGGHLNLAVQSAPTLTSQVYVTQCTSNIISSLAAVRYTVSYSKICVVEIMNESILYGDWLIILLANIVFREFRYAGYQYL